MSGADERAARIATAFIGVAILAMAGCSSGASRGQKAPPLPTPSKTDRAPAATAKVFINGKFVATDEFTHGQHLNSEGLLPCWTIGNAGKQAAYGLTSPLAYIKQGAQVVVTDASGKIIGTSHLEAGQALGPIRNSVMHINGCAFPFSLNAPLNSPFYRVRVGSHSKVISRAQLRTGTIKVG